MERALERLAAGETDQFLRRLDLYFRRVADPRYRKFLRGLKAAEGLGVRAPLLRKLSAAVLKRWLPEPLLRRAVAGLWKEGASENRLLAILLIQDHWKRRQLALADRRGSSRLEDALRLIEPAAGRAHGRQLFPAQRGHAPHLAPAVGKALRALRHRAART